MSQNSNDISKHLTFGELEVLIDCLMTEAENAQKDILRKSEALTETQSTISENENKIFEIDEAVKALASMIGTVEDDLLNMDYNFDRIEEAIDKLESVEGKLYCLPKTERETFMETLNETDAGIRQLQAVVGDMQATRQFAVPPFVTIFNILRCHMETLCSTQKKMDFIMDKMLEISTHWPMEENATSNDVLYKFF